MAFDLFSSQKPKDIYDKKYRKKKLSDLDANKQKSRFSEWFQRSQYRFDIMQCIIGCLGEGPS